MIPWMVRLRKRRISKVGAFIHPTVYLVGLTCFVGEYKTILQLLAVLSNGKLAKKITDKAVDTMQDVQNLRKAIYE